ncbi:hypothetical protein L249_4856 [Ophiocordyceps polyrhachis-furcata BCC 54312]|uniref:Far11/STRP C-terminal domain-containing protein n=1 Tax=Ophiocordyceps polyrhachis-furcata BCC 54312 TaxID=1330021 RepID=A0A367L2M3_9HYPO|nr:hypothetical protein L249_4856 [Ophiocordyceps polyrhachis-furcata BCC 54312]
MSQHAGAMNSLWPSRVAPDSAKPTVDVEDTGEVAESQIPSPERPLIPPLPMRPGLTRNSLQPGPPQQQPPPPGPALGRGKQPVPAPTDSLSLIQLRRIVAEVNRAEPAAYDFVYADTGSNTDEIDEWFVYQFWQWVRLNAAQKAFEWHWNLESGGSVTWDEADDDTRTKFVQAAIAGVQSNDAALRSASIGKLVYLVLGRWANTAIPSESTGDRSVASGPQLQAIKAGVECLSSLEGLPVIWESLRNCFEMHWSGDNQQQASPQEAQDELMNLMTIMYITIQETLNDPDDMSSSYEKLLDLNPSLVDFMLTATSKLRWDEQNTMPHTQIFLLFWKSILLVFGGSEELKNLKKSIAETDLDKDDGGVITASPLDYHAFRQEITSKYPSYVPPPPILPLEAEHTSILPPLPNQSFRSSATQGIIPAPAHTQNGSASILHQPVHIATPAPSPPPSPGVGGKGAKKQNYQTNQNFPFMYPPLDATSNSAGGKGMAGAYDAVISRRWDGSDIPASILEAGELFSSRVRMTRATRQLWEERERFLKYERGWDVEDDEDDFDIESLGMDGLTPEEKQALDEIKAEYRKSVPPPTPREEHDFGPRPERLSERDKQRLIAVERFYKEAFPHLQSLVIVLLRPILVNVTAVVTQQATVMTREMAFRAWNNRASAAHRAADVTAPIDRTEEPEASPEEVDAARTREITSKAMTGILILLLKWLRVSREFDKDVLKYEYFTQLLLDSNYIPLVLKLFAHQDIQKVVDSNMDRVENSFFYFCNLRSTFKDKTESDMEQEEGEGEEEEEEAEEAAGPSEAKQEEQEGGDDSDDSAVPAPIKRRHSPEQGDEDDEADAGSDDQGSARPEVDELGYPVNAQPTEPITDFSRRNFFSLINYLRVMQKICKGKAHRNLLLVQYKSSAILRKSLRIPQKDLRLYTLKLFKNQVPYCGRKWRQSNMRVITSVYLHCRPELRDEWLAGSDVDAVVESALPLEQALRSLTHWRNVRHYSDKISPDIRAAMREEQDFFTRELEKMHVNWAELADEEMGGEMDLAGPSSP